MSEHGDMVRWWTMTLITILNGLSLAMAMLRVEGQEDVVEVSMEAMRGMTDGYTPEQKRVLVVQLALLSGLAVRVEPPS